MDAGDLTKNQLFVSCLNTWFLKPVCACVLTWTITCVWFVLCDAINKCFIIWLVLTCVIPSSGLSSSIARAGGALCLPEPEALVTAMLPAVLDVCGFITYRVLYPAFYFIVTFFMSSVWLLFVLAELEGRGRGQDPGAIRDVNCKDRSSCLCCWITFAPHSCCAQPQLSVQPALDLYFIHTHSSCLNVSLLEAVSF